MLIQNVVSIHTLPILLTIGIVFILVVPDYEDRLPDPEAWARSAAAPSRACGRVGQQPLL